jgi:hypothetical protein
MIGNPLFAPRQQIVFDAAVFPIVEHLVGADLAAAGNLDEILHVGEVEVADAPTADLARALKHSERLDRFLERNGTAPMQQVKVDYIDSQP